MVRDYGYAIHFMSTSYDIRRVHLVLEVARYVVQKGSLLLMTESNQYKHNQFNEYIPFY